MWWLNTERKEIAEKASNFAETNIVPIIDKMEKNEYYPREELKKLAENNMFGYTVSEEYGGQGPDYINYAVMIEQLAKRSHTFGLLTFLATDLTLSFIEKMGTKQQAPQIKKLIHAGIKGEKLYGVGFTEATGLTDPTQYQTTAKLDGDEWVINGGKVLITNADVADNIFVICKTSHYDPKTMTGLTLINIPTNVKGFKSGDLTDKLGWKGSHTGQIYFNNVRVPKENVIGEVDKAWFKLNQIITPMLSTYGPINLGAMEGLWEKTLNFLQHRIEMNASLWDSHESIRTEMTRLWIKISNYRSAVFSAMKDLNDGEDITNQAIALKLTGANLLEEVASASVEYYGGAGTIYETDIERFYRDAKMGALGCGSDGVMVNALATLITLQTEKDSPAKSTPQVFEGTPEHIARQILAHIRSTSSDDNSTNYSTNSIDEAPVVLCAGRGVNSPELFKMLQEIGKKLNLPVTYTMGFTNFDFVTSKENMIGISGHKIHPKLLVSFGVSGASQHVDGLKGTQEIISINTDKNAPMNKMASVEVISDVKEIIRELKNLVE